MDLRSPVRRNARAACIQRAGVTVADVSANEPRITSNIREALRLFDKSQEGVRAVTSAINEALRPEPGPYAIFHHLSHLGERIGDLQAISLRLGVSRFELKEVFELQNHGMREGHGRSVELQRLHDQLIAR